MAVYLGESLADVKKRWSGDRVSEVGGRKQQGRDLQIDHLETQKQTYCSSAGTNILMGNQNEDTFYPRGEGEGHFSLTLHIL